MKESPNEGACGGQSLSRLFSTTAALVLLLLLPACKEELVPQVFAPSQAHEAYLFGLEQAGLGDSALAAEWVQASQEAIENPQLVELPFREVVYVDPAQPRAFGYRFPTRRGQVVKIQVEETVDFQLFIDVFRPQEEPAEPFVLVASAAEEESQTQFEPRGENDYILRIQPELLRGGSFTVSVEMQPAFEFPVEGRSTSAILSRFGVPREGGRRRHHGVDIFAPRHTPVVAPSRAYVGRVGENRLGGNVIWLRDRERSLTMYFAHLQEQKVEEGVWVEKGDIIGTVGNSGNARTTPTHLHFGIYSRPEGPVDPYYYLYRSPDEPPAVETDTALIGRWVRAANDGIHLRQRPDRSSDILTELAQEVPLRIIGASGNYFKIGLPDGVRGYVLARLLETDPAPLAELKLAQDTPLLLAPSTGSLAIGEVSAGEKVDVLGDFLEFRLVESNLGKPAWLAHTDQTSSTTVAEE